MNQELSEETRRRIAQTCGELAKEHRLGAGTRRALEERMSEKVRTCLSGEEPLTESDAFAIACERLGDPEKIQELLGRVHAPDSLAALGRRVLALVILVQAADVAWALVLGIATLTVRAFEPGFLPGNYLAARLLSPVYLLDWHELASSFIKLAGVFIVLWRWKATLRSGGWPWLLRWPLRRMLGLFALLALALPLARLSNQMLLCAPLSIHPPREVVKLLFQWSDRIYRVTDWLSTLRFVSFTLIFAWWCGFPSWRGVTFFGVLQNVIRFSLAIGLFFCLKLLSYHILLNIIRFDVMWASDYAMKQVQGHYFLFNENIYQWHPLDFTFLGFYLVFGLIMMSWFWRDCFSEQGRYGWIFKQQGRKD